MLLSSHSQFYQGLVAQPAWTLSTMAKLLRDRMIMLDANWSVLCLFVQPSTGRLSA